MADGDNVKAGWVTGFDKTTILTGDDGDGGWFLGDVILEVHPFVGDHYPGEHRLNGIRGVGAGSGGSLVETGTGVVGLGGPLGGNGVIGAAGAGDPRNANAHGNFEGAPVPSQLGTGVEGQGGEGGEVTPVVTNNVMTGIDVGFSPGVGVLGIGGPPLSLQNLVVNDKPIPPTSVGPNDLGGGPGVVGVAGGTPSGQLPSFQQTRCSGVFGWGAPTVPQGAGFPDHPPGRGGVFGSTEIAAILAIRGCLAA
jgi:hypothetical protein